VSMRLGNRVRRNRVKAVAGTVRRMFDQPEHDMSTVVCIMAE
jgi:hypothetical protein